MHIMLLLTKARQLTHKHIMRQPTGCFTKDLTGPITLRSPSSTTIMLAPPLGFAHVMCRVVWQLPAAGGLWRRDHPSIRQGVKYICGAPAVL
jgi:hypothetical protein